ncbi:MAG: OmpA family protein [Gammaproteobacteria bacterium]|nr:OmpA family protein [Gammaproteobacteria bacterium]
MLFVVLIAGCVSKSKYESAVQESEAVKQERDALADNLRLLQSRIGELESQKKQLETDLESTNAKLSATNKELDAKNAELADINSQLAKKNELLSSTSAELEAKQLTLAEITQKLQATADYMKKTDKLYDDLVKELSSELDAKTIKIKEMKDGVNVNLSEAILFSSGSADLNESGQAVIAKVSEKLKDIPHQVIVAGFTDNLPIRGKLTEKFPTNWELAGARAASVVRLLEKQGVDRNKLTAVSFGENQPVESNDTAEGRSQNRRIEIRMRPVD